MRKLANFAGHLFAIGAAAIGLSALTLASGLVALQTDFGHRTVATLVSDLVSTRDFGLKIESIEELSMDRIRLGVVRVHDGRGPWLDIADAAFEWRPGLLLDGRLTVASATIGRIEVARVPEERASQESGGLSLPVALELSRFAIDRLVLDSVVAGVAVTITATGSAALRTDGTGEFRLDARRIDGGGGSVSARTVFDLLNDALDIGLLAREPAGGLLVRWLEIPGLPPTSVELTGKGTLRDWRGTLSASANGVAGAAAEIVLGYNGARLQVDLSGTADIIRVLPAATGGLIGPDARFDLHFGWNPAGNSVAIRPSRIITAALDADFTGTIDPRTMVAKATGRIAVRDADVVSSLLAPVVLRGAEAHFDLGDRTLIADVVVSGFTVGDPAADSIVGSAPQAHLSMRTDPDGWFDIIDLGLELAVGPVSGSGSVEPTAARVDLALTAPAVDLGIVGGAFRVPVSGRGSAILLVRGGRDDLSGTFSAVVDECASPVVPTEWTHLARGSTLMLDFQGGVGTAWRLDDIAFDAGSVRVNGTVVLPAAMDTLDAHYRVVIPDLAPMAKAAGVMLAGGASANGTAGGPWHRLAGRLDVTTSSPWGAVEAGTGWRVEGPTRLGLRNLSIRVPGTLASGDLTVDLETGGVDGPLKAAIDDVAAFAALAGIDAGGPAAANLHLFTEGAHQGISFGVAADGLGLGEHAAVRIQRAEVTGALRDVFGTPRFDARIETTKLSARGFEVEHATVGIAGDPSRQSFKVSASGAPTKPFDVSATGTSEHTGDSVRLRVERSDGHAFGVRIRLAAPVEADIGTQAIAFRGLDLAIADGRIGGDFQLTESEVALRGRASALPLAILHNWLPGAEPSGRVDGEIRITGSPDAPEGALSVTIRTAEIGVADRRIGLSGNLNGRLDGGLLRWSGKTDFANAGSLETTGLLPLRLAVRPFAFGPPAGATLQLEARGRADLGIAWSSFGFDPHRLDGSATFDLTVAGTADRRTSKGSVRVDGGRYENFDTATVIDDIAVEARLEGDVLRIARGSGRAGGGTVALAGTIGGLLDAHPVLDLRLSADKAELIARDDATLSASADIRVTGGPERIDVGGRVATEQAEIRLVGMESGGGMMLDVVEINGRGDTGKAAAAPPTAADAATVVGLDLEIDVPRRFFVRGRGLDSEWSGRFALGGTVAEPRLTGRLSPVRGQYSFSGKAFVFKEGAIELRGDAAMTPTFDLVAEHRTRDLTARLRVRGTADRPEIELSSVPSMPKDEILSRVLFDRGVARISAIEAAQLADAVATLSGRGGGGILDTARRMLGVDVLRVEGGDARDTPGVTAGRYVGEGIFVGVTQGADPKGGEARVEVEVTPNVSVETDIGPNTSGRVGARWSLDY